MSPLSKSALSILVEFHEGRETDLPPLDEQAGFLHCIQIVVIHLDNLFFHSCRIGHLLPSVGLCRVVHRDADEKNRHGNSDHNNHAHDHKLPHDWGGMRGMRYAGVREIRKRCWDDEG
ncbi:hypothetical protein J6590_018373 [Homalodisca vitripennis]|nr:hypothetical protein J6590_018373 [Homalodisca vitripennis]